MCSTCHHTLHKMTHLFGNCTHNPKRFSPVQHSNYFNVIQHTCTTVKMEAASFSETSVNSYQSQHLHMRFGTLIVATIYLQLIQNRYMFRSFTVFHCSHQHCVQPVASDVVDRSIRTINTTGAAKCILRLPHRWKRVVHNAGDYSEGE